MKLTRIFGAIAGLALCAGVAFAASTSVTLPYVASMSTTDAVQVIPNGAPTAGNVYATALQLRNFILGGNSQLGTTAPTLTSCGTGSPSVTGTNTAGVITVGTSATGCVATFGTAYNSAPACVVVSQTAYATTTPAYSVSATAITITQTSTSGNKYSYVCIAQPGG